MQPKSTGVTASMSESKAHLTPLKFTTFYKPVIWGGSRIAHFKGEKPVGDKIGESWELSALEGRESRVVGGPLDGCTLQDLIDRYGAEFIGQRLFNSGVREFPLLIKLIDANENLSLQVHPGEEMARRCHGCSSKVEMWYVIDALPNASLLAGFNRNMTIDEYHKAVGDGSILDCVAQHTTHKGDVFFLPSGRIHAIGAGNFLLEVQQSCDITYRVYDYGRGRELHTQLASEALDFEVHDEYRSRPQKVDDNETLLERCPEFEVRLITIGDHDIVKHYSGESFLTMTCVEGDVTIMTGGDEVDLPIGHTVLIPASLRDVTLRGAKGSSVVVANC